MIAYSVHMDQVMEKFDSGHMFSTVHPKVPSNCFSAIIRILLFYLGLLYPLFSLEKKGILISCQSRSVVRPSVRLSVRAYVRPSRFL